jgi:hypothetical protein
VSRTHTCYTGRVVIVCVAATEVLAHVQVLQHTAAEHAKNKLYDISAGFAHSNGVIEFCPHSVPRATSTYQDNVFLPERVPAVVERVPFFSIQIFGRELPPPTLTG